MGHLLGYARVSTTDQHPQLQVDASRRRAATGCLSRPPAAPAATDLSSSRSWTNCAPVTPWSSGSSTGSAAPCGIWSTTVTGLAECGVGFRSLQEAIDTTTPGGKLVFHVFAALAEFERDLIRE